MAATDYIITPADASNVNVQSQPDILQGTASANKKVFDNYCDMIVDHFNDLCTYIENQIGTEVDDEVLALFVADGWTPDE